MQENTLSTVFLLASLFLDFYDLLVFSPLLWNLFGSKPTVELQYSSCKLKYGEWHGVIRWQLTVLPLTKKGSCRRPIFISLAGME